MKTYFGSKSFLPYSLLKPGSKLVKTVFSAWTNAEMQAAIMYGAEVLLRHDAALDNTIITVLADACVHLF